MGILKRFFGGVSQNPKNRRLLRAIHNVATNDSPENRSKLYGLLVESTLLVPIPESEQHLAEGTQKLNEDTPILFCTSKNEEGKTIVFVFTDRSSLLAWKPEGSRYVALLGRVLFPMAVQMDAAQMVVNPSGPVGGMLTRSEIEALARGEIPDGYHAEFEIPAGTQVGIAPLDQQVPGESLERLREILGKHSEIRAGYLFSMAMRGQPAHPVVGIQFTAQFDPQLMETLCREAGPIIQECLGGAKPIDFFPMQENDPMSRSLEGNIAPFYQS